MSQLTQRINRGLGSTVGVQITRGRRSVKLTSDWFVTLVYFNSLLTEISSVPGDLVECGVAFGSSLAMLASLMRAVGQVRRVWGFDSWEGLPPPSDADLSQTSRARPGGFSEASPGRVRDEFSAYGWDDDDFHRTVRLVPGLFEHTLPRFSGDIALLHIDADLYESYRSCLTNLWPKLQVGGVVAFDEYHEPDKWPGARHAVDDFLRSLAEDAAELRRDDRSGKWWARKLRG
jgi:hypothetical protein